MWGVQNAKDSFYEVMRDRLASVNPERTMVVRGVTRPAVVVDENETANVAAEGECFHLRWTGATVGGEGELPLVVLSCEISYATAGNPWNGSLDRGRTLGAMDAELLSVSRTYPQNAAKRSYAALAQGGSPLVLQSRIWWSDVMFEPAKVEADRLTRVAKVQVMSFQETGEL